MFRSITGSSWKKETRRFGSRHSERQRSLPHMAATPAQETESLPTTFGTWLLAAVAAPDFSLPDMSGQVQTLTALRGKPVLLNFWVAQSASCQEDLKMLQPRLCAMDGSRPSIDHRKR
jgi:hypothetical protein